MAYENCTNCGAKISCGCEYQIADDGTHCCDNCIDNYNLAMNLATAIVETITTKKSKKKNESTIELPSGNDESSNDEEPGVL
jgi:hypothetical protein